MRGQSFVLSILYLPLNKDTISSLYERPLAEELSAIDFEVSVDQWTLK